MQKKQHQYFQNKLLRLELGRSLARYMHVWKGEKIEHVNSEIEKV